MTLRNAIREWRRKWPLVSRRTMQAEVGKARTAGRAEMQDNLGKEREMLAQVLGRLAQIEYRRVDRRYQMTLYFDPAMFSYGTVTRDEQQYLARNIARRVEYEIASSKFIKDASDREMREGTFYPFPMTGGPRDP